MKTVTTEVKNLCGHIGSYTSLPIKSFNMLNNNIVLTKEKLEFYKISSEIYHKSYAKGFSTEAKVLSMCNLLEGLNLSYLSKIGSKLDCVKKIDIVLRFENEESVGFQIKSNERKAIETYDTRLTGIFWVDEKCSLTDLLFTLSAWLKKPIKQEVLKVINLAKNLSKRTLLIKGFKLSREDMEVLRVLNLALIKNNEIVFY